MIHIFIAQRLKELRISKNYTQDYVSSQLHMARSSYCNYENGFRTPSLESVIAFADFYNISIEQLLGIDDNRHPAMQLTSAEEKLIRDYRRMSPSIQKEISEFVLFKEQRKTVF